MAIGKTFYGSKRRFEQLTVPGLVVLVVVLLTLLVLLPQAKGLFEDIKQNRLLKEQGETLNQKATTLKSLDPTELTNRVNKLELATPSEQDVGYFLNGLRSVTRRAGVEFNGADLLVSKSQLEEGPREETTVQMDVKVAGELLGLRQFLREIDESLPIMELESFSFRRSGDGVKFDGSLQILFYFLPKPNQIGKVSNPLVVVSKSEKDLYDQIFNLKEPDVVRMKRVPLGNPKPLL